MVWLTKIGLTIQSKTFVDQFQPSTINRFVLLMRLVRDTSQGNSLLSALCTNYIQLLRPVGNGPRLNIRRYNDCSCQENFNCVSEASIYINDSYTSSLWVVPGFYQGCYILEALRQSWFESLYNQSCLSELQYYMPSRYPLNATALNASVPSRFTPFTSIGDILDQLMLEQWTHRVIYGDYYEMCRPSECSYTITKRSDAIYVVTTLIGLVGGLMKTLNFSVPRMIRLVLKCRRRYNLRKITDIPRLSWVGEAFITTQG